MLLNIIIALVVFYLTIVATVYVLRLPEYNSFLIGLFLIVVCLIAGSVQAFNGKLIISGVFGRR